MPEGTLLTVPATVENGGEVVATGSPSGTENHRLDLPGTPAGYTLQQQGNLTSSKVYRGRGETTWSFPGEEEEIVTEKLEKTTRKVPENISGQGEQDTTEPVSHTQYSTVLKDPSVGSIALYLRIDLEQRWVSS